MKYNDIFRHHIPALNGQWIAGDHCLVWTSNYEHAVFDITDKVHPAAKYVWLPTAFTHIGWVKYISKFMLENGIWKRVEYSEGNIPLVNNNPFNNSDSIFIQNQ